MFLRVGYAGTSLKRIGTELGVSAPALYWYFPSKEDLYIAVIEASMRDFVDFVRAGTTSTEPSEQLEQLVRAHVTWQLDQSESARAFDLSRVQTPSIPAERFEATRQMQLEYRGDVRLLLQRGQTLGIFDIDDIKVSAAAIITLCEYVHTWFNPNGPLTSKEVADEMVALARRMVGEAVAGK